VAYSLRCAFTLLRFFHCFGFGGVMAARDEWQVMAIWLAVLCSAMTRGHQRHETGFFCPFGPAKNPQNE
jgi:hypothetical protein